MPTSSKSARAGATKTQIGASKIKPNINDRNLPGVSRRDIARNHSTSVALIRVIVVNYYTEIVGFPHIYGFANRAVAAKSIGTGKPVLR